MDILFEKIKPVDDMVIKIVNNRTKEIFNVPLKKPKNGYYPADLKTIIPYSLLEKFGNAVIYLPVEIRNSEIFYKKIFIDFNPICNAMPIKKHSISIAITFFKDRTMLSIYPQRIIITNGIRPSCVKVFNLDEIESERVIDIMKLCCI